MRLCFEKPITESSGSSCEEEGAAANATDISGTQLSFDKSYNLLGIRQNWKCPSTAQNPTSQYERFFPLSFFVSSKLAFSNCLTGKPSMVLGHG